jgi:hypothetical protein
MTPFFVRAGGAVVEAWSGYRVQFGGMERHAWQKTLKEELKQALSRLALAGDVSFAGYYDTTDSRVSDTENSLFTNFLEAMPRGVRCLRFEQGMAAPPRPPVPIDLIGGHLHYYRYTVGEQWLKWKPDRTLASWDRLPRLLPDDGSARPFWYALRDANANGLIALPGTELDLRTNFGLRLIVHANKSGPRNAISFCERIFDGSIAAFHNDRCSAALLSALAPKFTRVSEQALGRALDHPIGPLFTTPAIRTTPGFIQFSPADEHCKLGELTILQDSTSQCPELSGELFTICPLPRAI